MAELDRLVVLADELFGKLQTGDRLGVRRATEVVHARRADAILEPAGLFLEKTVRLSADKEYDLHSPNLSLGQGSTRSARPSR